MMHIEYLKPLTTCSAFYIGSAVEPPIWFSFYELDANTFVVTGSSFPMTTEYNLSDLIDGTLQDVVEKIVFMAYPDVLNLKITDIDLQTLKKCLMTVLPNATFGWRNDDYRIH